MNVLIACEESQTVCKAFRENGHRAFSCDIQKCSGGHPEWHINGDCLKIIGGGCEFMTEDGITHEIAGKWDLLIAHPPCTYLTNGGSVQMFRKETKEFPQYGTFQLVNVERLKKGIIARDFFMKMLDADCDHVAIENPIPMSVYMLPEATQIIQPFEFGESFSKKTCLWLRGLPKLSATRMCWEHQPMINGGGGRTERINYKGKKFATGSKNRSKTFPGIAEAMAAQWGENILDYKEIKLF